MTGEIHPRLRWHALTSRYVVAPLAAAIALALGAFALFTASAWPRLAVTRDDRIATALIVAVCGLVAVAVGWVAWSAFFAEYAWCRRLTLLLRGEPVAVRIVRLDWFGEGLPVLEVQPQDPAGAAPLRVVCMPSAAPLEDLPGTAARAYIESPDVVVLETERGLLWPKRR